MTRQPHRRLVRTVKVHPVVRTESDHHIVSASVRLLGRFAPNRPVCTKKRTPPLDRRRIVHDSTLRDQLKEFICAALRGPWMRGARDAESMNAAMTDTLRQAAEVLVPSAPLSLPTGGWCADPKTRQKMDDAFRDRDVAWEA